MKQRWKDAIANILGFPYSTPKKPSNAGSTMFVEQILDSDLKEMAKRNQAAHCIITDVAQDAVTGFQCLKPDKTEQTKFDAEVHTLFNKFIAVPLARALLQTRLYGYCGLLIGYNTRDKFTTKVKPNTKINYLQAIPKPWINEVTLKKDNNGNTLLPLEIDHYTLSAQNNEKVDGTKLVHLYNPGIEEESLEGESSLECVYDDLTILKSMDWGTGQSMWRNGGGLTVFIAPEGSNQEQMNGIHEVGEEINAKTVLTMPPGTDVKSARGTNLNPVPSYKVIMEQISMGTRIPLSILVGSQSGTLSASEKDRKDYYELLDNIQKNILTPALTAILIKFQESGQLPNKEFIIEWDKTPVWLTEEAKGKLYIAQTELQTNIARRELAQAKQKELEYKTRREELKAAQKDSAEQEEEEMAQLPAIILEAPHAKLIWEGIQNKIAKPVRLKHINEPAYIVADRVCYGIIRLTNVEQITESQFKERTPEHLVTDEERSQWDEDSTIYIHSFSIAKMFNKPKACEYIQSRHHAKYVDFK